MTSVNYELGDVSGITITHIKMLTVEVSVDVGAIWYIFTSLGRSTDTSDSGQFGPKTLRT